ncbi:MAG TPA: glycosyltransferase domain-containing protein [Pyrinomonadaceae bacterium]|nr:glycosyltransferase domain-containing protein [Pyrinomonadaceae bacterium]
MSAFNIQPNPTNGARRKAVYTFIFGDYDNLKPPTIFTPGWDYICFTDNPNLRSDVWDVRLSLPDPDDPEMEPKKHAVKHMILFHQYLEGYDLSLSIGAQIELNCNLDDLMANQFGCGDDMMICRHSERDCIYDEAEICKTWGLDYPERIDAQIQRYRAIGYPAHNGLYTTGLIARRHDRPNLQAMCELWWDECRFGSRRDQLSLNFAIWRSAPIKISAIDYARQFVVNPNFIIHPHTVPNPFDGKRIKFSTGKTSLISGLLSLFGARTSYIGCVDEATHYGVRGWAADRTRPNVPISISLYERNNLIATVPANQPRPDVGAYLGDNGRHGFTIPLPVNLRKRALGRISIRFEPSHREASVSDAVCKFAGE